MSSNERTIASRSKDVLVLEATTGAPSHRPRGGCASQGAVWQGIPAMEKLLTQLKAAKNGCPVTRASQDCSEVGSQVSTIFENNNSELCVPPTRSDTRGGKAKQSQSYHNRCRH